MVLKTIFPGCGVRASLMLFFYLGFNINFNFHHYVGRITKGSFMDRVIADPKVDE